MAYELFAYIGAVLAAVKGLGEVLSGLVSAVSLGPTAKALGAPGFENGRQQAVGRR
jgi:hypothetical protein